jgi:hypothetical protein
MSNQILIRAALALPTRLGPANYTLAVGSETTAVSRLGAAGKSGGMAHERKRTVEREVRADDPELSPEANELLTSELQEALGTDRVEVAPEDAERLEQVPGSGHSTFGATAAANKLLIGITFAALIVVGVIVALATGSWWAVVVAAAVHALATLVIISATLRASTQTEHMSPGAAARLEEEGVADPDRALSELVARYTGDEDGAGEVVAPGHNRVTATPDDDRVRAQAQQRTAQTPSAEPVEPAGDTGAPMLLPLVAVGGSLLVGIAAAALEGGIAWLGALLLAGAAVAWLLVRIRMSRAENGRRTPPHNPLVPTAAIVVVAVAAGVIIVGAIAGYL